MPTTTKQLPRSKHQNEHFLAARKVWKDSSVGKEDRNQGQIVAAYNPIYADDTGIIGRCRWLCFVTNHNHEALIKL